MSEYYLMHSAKGTSWKKKEHKYIKKVDGKYYYLTKEQKDIVEKAQKEIDETTEKAEVARDLSSSYLKRSSDSYRESESLKKSADERMKNIGTPSGVYGSIQAGKASSEYSQSYEKNKEFKKYNTLARSEYTKYKQNIQKSTMAKELRNSTIEGTGIAWINNLLDKFKKK